MEQNVQVVAKKLWHIVRVAFYMIRKNMNKRKLILELKYLAMKRPKLTGKSFPSKFYHHHSHPCGGAYEFSCSNTPNHTNYVFPFQFNYKKRAQNHAPIKEEVKQNELHAGNKVLEMMLTLKNCPNYDIEGSPLPYFYSPLPGFGLGFGSGPSPVVRVTDSPYPLHDVVEVGNYKVDEAAEEFIRRFYDQLNKQQRISNF